MEKSSSIKDIINNTMEQVRTIIDADTVVGKEIVTNNGTVIIPISKVSMGFASGGLDLTEKGKSFSGGSGTGVTVSPLGFLVVNADGKVEMLPMVREEASPLEQITEFLDHTPEILNRIKAVFTNEDPDDDLAVVTEELEKKYAEKLADDVAEETEEPALSKKELKKMMKQEAKAAKAAKRNDL